MYGDYVYHMKEENKNLNPFIGEKVNSVNTETLGQYDWSIQKHSANTRCIGRVFLYWPSILAVFVVGILADLAIYSDTILK